MMLCKMRIMQKKKRKIKNEKKPHFTKPITMGIAFTVIIYTGISEII